MDSYRISKQRSSTAQLWGLEGETPHGYATANAFDADVEATVTAMSVGLQRTGGAMQR